MVALDEDALLRRAAKQEYETKPIDKSTWQGGLMNTLWTPGT